MELTQQQRWDESLIHCYTNFKTILDCSYRFVSSNPSTLILAKLKDHKRINHYIASLDLKRCPWHFDPAKEEDVVFHVPWKVQTRVFVAAYSPQLNNALLSEKLDNELILESIDNYRWQKKRITNVARHKELVNERNRAKTTRFIPLRSLGKKHDWSTVK